MNINTMKQLRNEHRKSDGKLSLKAFAKTLGVEDIIKTAHFEANQPRSATKRDRTRAATAARKNKSAKPAVKS